MRGNWRQRNNRLPKLMTFAIKLPNRQGKGVVSHGPLGPEMSECLGGGLTGERLVPLLG
jgi:hypothetical protein